MTEELHDVVIVGGGPVGMFLACCLADTELSFCVLERESTRRSGSRSIGVHPPALERARAIGIAEPLIEAGVRIGRAHAFSSRRHLGAVEFERTPGPFSFVLSIPQERTEAILADQLAARRPGALMRGAPVRQVAAGADRVEVELDDGRRVAGRFVAGCDGKRSAVRRSLGIELRGRALPGAYLMGDAADDTALGSEAAIFLADDGLVESFPLPDRRRRWVISEAFDRARVDPDRLCQVVADRTGISVRRDTISMLSAFGVEQCLAPSFAEGRVALAGDAAHLVSPFGGQGMNLGWLDAYQLAGLLAEIVHRRRDHGPAFARYDRRRRRAARAALRRAAFNTYLGRAPRHPRLREAAVRALLTRPTSDLLARIFTMRGL